MEKPMMMNARSVAEDTTLLGAWMPVPGFGVLAVNAWLINDEEPLLIDTGLAGLRSDFIEQLELCIDPRKLCRIYITHADADHVGNLAALLELAPDARIVTTYIGMGKLAMQGIPPERCDLVNPGQSFNIGDRKITVMQPPLFDAPETTALYDEKNDALFSSDCFGALLNRTATDASAIHAHELHDGMVGWASADAPWAHELSREILEKRFEAIRSIAPKAVFSSHLPPAFNITDRLIDNLLGLSGTIPFTAPDQAQLEELLSLPASA